MSGGFEIVRRGYYIRRGFDLIGTLQRLAGPVIEVGGPTHDENMPFLNDYELRRLGKTVIITNVNKEDGVDALMDATQLPVRDASLSAVTAAYLPYHVKERYMREVWRVLQPEGVVMTAGLNDQEIGGFKAEGFDIVVSKRQMSDDGKYLLGRYDIIAQKPVE